MVPKTDYALRKRTYRVKNNLSGIQAGLYYINRNFKTLSPAKLNAIPPKCHRHMYVKITEKHTQLFKVREKEILKYIQENREKQLINKQVFEKPSRETQKITYGTYLILQKPDYNMYLQEMRSIKACLIGLMDKIEKYDLMLAIKHRFNQKLSEQEIKEAEQLVKLLENKYTLEDRLVTVSQEYKHTFYLGEEFPRFRKIVNQQKAIINAAEDEAYRLERENINTTKESALAIPYPMTNIEKLNFFASRYFLQVIKTLCQRASK